MSEQIKLSYSSYETYVTCGKKYEYEKKHGLREQKLSSALLFGSAVDNALNETLKAKKETGEFLPVEQCVERFKHFWTYSSDRDGKLTNIRTSKDVEYSKYDALEIEPDMDHQDESVFPTASPLNWYSLRFKGEVLIHAYYEVFLPKIKEVKEVQFEVSSTDEEGDKLLRGNIDAILVLNDGHTYIIDNKTTSVKYDEDIIGRSKQLSLYSALTGIDRAGYFVLNKKLNKEHHRECVECGAISDSGRIKNCDSLNAKGKRCGGELKSSMSFSATTQCVLGDINQTFKNNFFESISEVFKGIKHEVFPRNYENCMQYNRPCPFFEMCHKGLSIDDWKARNQEKQEEEANG